MARSMVRHRAAIDSAVFALGFLPAEFSAVIPMAGRQLARYQRRGRKPSLESTGPLPAHRPLPGPAGGPTRFIWPAPIPR